MPPSRVITTIITIAVAVLCVADRRAARFRGDHCAGAGCVRGGGGALRPCLQRLDLELQVRPGEGWGWLRLKGVGV